MVKKEKFFVVIYRGAEGERKKKHFKDRGEARLFYDQKKVELVNFGTAAATLDEKARAEYLECKELLEPYRISLRDAVKALLPQLEAENASTNVETALKDFLEAKKADKMSARYLKDLKSRLGIFSKKFGSRNMASITTADIDDWLRCRPGDAINRNNYKRILGVFFGYFMKRGSLLKNPALNASKAKEAPKPVGILTPEQATALLKNCPDEILPAVALGLFAGLRPESEVWRLEWQHIDFDQGLIEIDARKTKTSAHRFVTILDNLRDWLLPHKKTKGAVSPSGDKYYSLLQGAREAAKISEWPQDCLRHSYGSYHYGKFQDIGRTTAQMGHTNSNTFLKSYRKRVTPAEADKYWEIKPAVKTRKLPGKAKKAPPPPPKKKAKKR